jgi:hypothetical protein
MRVLSLALVWTMAVSASAAAQEKGDPPAPEGCAYVAFHAYSECKGTGDDKFWWVVTDGLYACTNGKAPGRQRVHEIKTDQPCDGKNKVKAPRPQTSIKVGLQDGCQSPVKDGELIVQECIEKLWYNVKYVRYRCLSGEIRLDAPRYFATGKPCGEDQAPPALDAANLGTEGAAPAAAMSAAPVLDFGQASQWTNASQTPPRDTDTQRMMIDVLDIDVPGSRVADAQPVPPTVRGWFAQVWAMLARPVGRPWASAAFAGSFVAPGFWLDPFSRGEQGVTRASRVHAYLTSLGTSTGEAFDVQIVNDGTAPVRIGGEGVVVEPIKKGADKALRAELLQVASRGAGASSARANAYCLEFKLKPPSQGNMFKVSEPAVQQQYAAAREILRASSRLQAAGRLSPDSDPRDYFHSIRQWSLWVDEQRFNLVAYRKAFVERSKKNAEALGRKWSKDLEDGLTALVPHRWEEITKILREANRPIPGA